jgi:hypothetical protein
MTNCKNCGTRHADRDRHCPNCGRTLSPGNSLSGVQALADPSLTQAPEDVQPDAKEEPKPKAAAAKAAPAKPAKAARIVKRALRKAFAPEPVAPPEELEEELPEIEVPDVGVPEDDAPEIDVREVEAPEVEAPDETERSGAIASTEQESTEQEDVMPETTPSSLFSLRAEELRARIIEHPEMIEDGLQMYTGDADQPLGAEFSTDVGDIDLLAEGEDGALVVVQVVEREGGDPVGPVLEQLGWISKHVAGDTRPVRAIVLLEPPAPELSYAARAVAGQVTFKTWRVAVAVDDIVV